MPTINDSLSLLMDVPLRVPDEPGYGHHSQFREGGWASTGLYTDSRHRGYWLQAIQDTDAWASTFTGLYVRKPLSSFTATGNWQEVEQRGLGDTWLMTRGSSGSLVTTGASWSAGTDGLIAANRHLWLEVFPFVYPGTFTPLFTVAWGTQYSLVVYADGSAALNRTGGSPATLKTGSLFSDRTGRTSILVYMAPLFRRALYLFGFGSEMYWEDLARDIDTDATAHDAADPLVPAGTLTFTAHARLMMQLTEYVPVATGTMEHAGLPGLDYEPTETIDFQTPDGVDLLWADKPTGTDCTVAAAGFVPSTKLVPVQIALTPDVNRTTTPVLYGAGFRFAQSQQDRESPGTPPDVLAWVLSGSSMDVGEEETRLTVELRDSANLRGLHNRAVLLKCGADEVFKGLTTNPRNPGEDAIQRTILECSEWKHAEKMLLPNTYAFDGMNLVEAMKDVLTWAGVEAAEWQTGTTAVVLPRAAMEPASADAGPVVQPGTGTPVAEFARHLRDTYSDWILDRAPVAGAIKWRFLEPETTLTTPRETLYFSHSAAAAAGKDVRWCLHNWECQVTEPEATEVWVIGADLDGQPLKARYVHWSAQDATLAEEDRPANWVGERWLAILLDTSFITQGQVDAAAYRFGRKLTAVYDLATFEAEWHPSVWRHDLLTLSGYVLPTPESFDYNGDWRVRSFTVDFERDADWAARKCRVARYTVERRRDVPGGSLS